jgi:uncharacterized coiled-coil protein SlyX
MAGVPSFLQTRLDNLEKNLNDGANLISELNTAITLADGPIAKRRYQADIDHISKLTKTWESEYIDLSTKINTLAPGDASANSKLAVVHSVLSDVQQGVTNIQVIINEAGGTFVENKGIYAGGNIDMRGAIVNVGSTLTNVQQSIGAMPGMGEDEKKKLNDLIEQLKKELEKAPADKQQDAGTVAKNLDSLVQEVSKEEKDEEVVELKSNRLKKAAENIAGALPAVAGIVGQILPFFIK